MDNTDTPDGKKPEKHLEGHGHAHHQFNPERAEEFREADRLEALRLDDLYEAVEIEETDTVLDLGTGSGALLPSLCKNVSDGVVLAADVSTQMLDMARQHAAERKLSNVAFLHNDPDTLSVHDATVNTVLIVSSLHEFSNPVPMLSEIHRVLEPGGRLAVIEWRHEETPEGPPLDHRLEADIIHEWLAQAGFNDTTVKPWNRQGYDLYITKKQTN